ncbi:MAG: O-antigen ligase domain-containing protein, partial [Microcoleus sp.]
MAALIPVVMYGWIPVVFYLFARYPTQRAVIASFVIAWLFLPQVSLSIPGLPPYNKMAAACYGVLLATIAYDADR